MINQSDLKAFILDLDGVITTTAKIHMQAWKQMFDTFMENYSKRKDVDYHALEELDYKEYIDGRPRYEGAQSYLASCGVILPYGVSTDAPGTETVCGLANMKNEIYLKLLHENGAQVYDDTIEMVKKWRIEKKKTAVISASKNCREVLSRAGITELFDVIVDGIDSEKYKIRGKPQPDIFLFAAKKLFVNPSEAAIIEDAPAGVKAGRDGGFALVIGISRNHHTKLLYENGADIVVKSLLDVSDTLYLRKKNPELIPSALDNFSIIQSHCKDRKILLLLDYDGTLTPIVARPELATLDESMRNVLRSLNQKMIVAIVSGRDLNDIRALVGLDNFFYAGSHGFEIERPGKIHIELEYAKRVLPELDNAEQEAILRFAEIHGIIIERKRFGLAIHYRLANESSIEIVDRIVERMSQKYEDLTVTKGKMVREFRPKIDWDKGKAVSRISELIFKDKKSTLPIYIGDDITDEDAFREVKGWGIGILVGKHDEKSIADFHLTDVFEVKEFLNKLLNMDNDHSFT